MNKSFVFRRRISLFVGTMSRLLSEKPRAPGNDLRARVVGRAFGVVTGRPHLQLTAWARGAAIFLFEYVVGLFLRGQLCPRCFSGFFQRKTPRTIDGSWPCFSPQATQRGFQTNRHFNSLLDVSMFWVAPCMHDKCDEHACCAIAFYLYSYIWNVHMHISMLKPCSHTCTDVHLNAAFM